MRIKLGPCRIQILGLFLPLAMAFAVQAGAATTNQILWRSSYDGDVALWVMNGAAIGSSANLGVIPSSWTIEGRGDFNGDGQPDILWRNANGDVVIWFMNGSTIASSVDIGVIPASWTIQGTGDFNGDAKTDILWRNANGDVVIWFMNAGTIASSTDLGVVPASWTIQGTGDFNGDAKADILWRNANGEVAIWFMNGGTLASSSDLGAIPTTWTVQGTGDFNGDAKSDILWRNANGDLVMWFMNGGTIASSADLGIVPVSWTIQGIGDFNSDNKADIAWQNSNGDVVVWLMNGGALKSSGDIGVIPSVWSVSAVGPGAVNVSAPPSGFSYTSPIVGSVRIGLLDPPSVTGNGISYAVSPALPAGVTLNPLTGLISGVPTVAAPQATYTIVATNNKGSASFNFTLTVNPAAPTGLSYSPNPYIDTVGSGALINPSVTGVVTSYSVTPALPSGITINPTTGVITGIATSASPQTTYQVTASNVSGSTSFPLSLVVNPSSPSFTWYYVTPTPTYVTYEVLLSDNTPGAVIYYTIDGRTPTINSPPYSGPFQVNVTTTIKAIAVANGAISQGGDVPLTLTLPLPSDTVSGFLLGGSTPTTTTPTTTTGSCAYYRAIGAETGTATSSGQPLCTTVSNGDGTYYYPNAVTKAGWLAAAQANPQQANATFVNRYDLNFTRIHQAYFPLNVGTTEGVNAAGTASIVCNFPGPDFYLKTGSIQIQQALNNAANGLNPLPCVAMDYQVNGSLNGGKPFVRMLVFNQSGYLQDSVDLDGKGQKTIPGACVACHGGNFGSSPNIGASFVPFDLNNLLYSFGSNPNSQIKALNLMVLNVDEQASPNPTPVSDLIHGWYDATTGQNTNCGGSGSLICPSQQTSYIPPAIFAHNNATELSVYSQIWAPLCRTCHLANTAPLEPRQPNDMLNFFNLVKPCSASGPLLMPNSKISFDRFWTTHVGPLASPGTSSDLPFLMQTYMGSSNCVFATFPQQ